MAGPDRAQAEALDAADPLGWLPDRFLITDPGLCYLDGNSLGRLPLATRDRLEAFVTEEWGGDLVRGWPRWIGLPTAVGDRLGALLGARPGEVVVCDSTTVNLYKVVAAALADPSTAGRPEVLVPEGEFPTDRYVLDGLARATGRTVRHGPAASADERTAVVVTSIVDYRSGAWLDGAAVCAAARAAGAMACVDLSHAAGSMPVDLTAWGADLAVGCTYKHLCAGPGAPGWLYVADRWQGRLRSPVQGWFAQREQFAMGAAFEPAPGIAAWLTGTPPIAGLLAVDCGVALVAEAGVEALAAKARLLTSLAVELIDARLAPLGFELASPRDPAGRGAHVSVAHPEVHRIARAAAAEGVVVDVRPPNLVRIGPAPISTRFVELWDGLSRLADLVAGGRHRRYANQPDTVT